MKNTLDQVLQCWFNLTQRFSPYVIAGTFLLAVSSLMYSINNLGMNTDTRDMLSPDLRWRQLDMEYENLFPHTIDNLLIVIEAGTPDQASDAASELYALLEQDREKFNSVYSHSQLGIFRESALLYLDQEELQDLADQLANNQAFLARLIEDQTLRGLTAMLEEALDAVADGEEADLGPVLEQFTRALAANRSGQEYQMSWQKLLFDEEDRKVYRKFIVVQPVLDYSEMLPAADLLDSIRKQAENSGIIDRYHVTLRFTGSVALSHEELASVMQTNTVAIIGAFIFVALVLMIGLGSGWLVLATLISLVTGLVLTAGFATLTVGELNLISVAFAVLYIGLGVDFAIHFCIRYRELLTLGNDRKAALEQTTRGIGSALVICAFTTAIGFYAFVPTDYDGVAELGWISGSGMFVSLLVTLTFMPALLKHLPVKTRNRPAGDNGIINLVYCLPSQYGGIIRIVALVAAVLSLYLVKDLEFDSNTLNLQPPDNASVKTFKDLLQEPGDGPLTAKIIADGVEDARRTVESLEKLPLVDKVVWLEDFIPENQEEKLLLIDEMNLLLGGEFFSTGSGEIDTPARLEALKSLHRTTGKYLDLDVAGLREFHVELTRYLDFIDTVDNEDKDRLLSQLEHSLLYSLPGRLATLETGLAGTALELSDLPEQFTSRWMKDGRYLLEVFPVENLQDNAARYRFVEQIQAADDRVTGGPVVTVEAGKAVISAFTQALLSAIAVITLLLFLFMPSRVDAVYVLAPLLLAALLTAATSVLVGIPLNFANVIALPLILGIGVDSAIHMIHRHRTGSEKGGLLATSSARAILISALTTIGSIGNLAFSPHVGTASMGMLLTTGIAMALITTLFLLPSLLEYNNKL